MTTTRSKPTYTWDKKYTVDNLPSWVYSEYKQPDTLAECEAKISSLECTLEDIDIQIKIKELTEGAEDPQRSRREFEKWKIQALKARQTHMYLLNAYKYWAILCDENKAEGLFLWGASTAAKLDELIEILYEDSPSMLEKIGKLRAQPAEVS